MGLDDVFDLLPDEINVLVLLDYVSRAHEIELRPSSVIRPSVSGINYLFNLLHGFLSNFSCCFPLSLSPYAQIFLNFWKKKLALSNFSSLFFSFLLTWDTMEKKSKRHSSLESLLNLFKLLFWIFFSVVLTKVLLKCLSVLTAFNVSSFWFLSNFDTHHCTLWGNQKTQLSGKRATVELAKRSEIWSFRVSVHCMQGTFDS